MAWILRKLELYVFISLDATALDTKVPTQLVLNSLEKRRNFFEDYIIIDELKKAIDLIMNSTYFPTNYSFGKPFIVT